MLVVSSPHGWYSANTVISAQPREMQLSTDLGTDAKGKTNILLHQAGNISACLLSTPFLTLSVYFLLEKWNPDLLNVHVFVLLTENKS